MPCMHHLKQKTRLLTAVMSLAHAQLTSQCEAPIYTSSSRCGILAGGRSMLLWSPTPRALSTDVLV